MQRLINIFSKHHAFDFSPPTTAIIVEDSPKEFSPSLAVKEAPNLQFLVLVQKSIRRIPNITVFSDTPFL